MNDIAVLFKETQVGTSKHSDKTLSSESEYAQLNCKPLYSVFIKVLARTGIVYQRQSDWHIAAEFPNSK